jgi:hypothetical protein
MKSPSPLPVVFLAAVVLGALWAGRQWLARSVNEPASVVPAREPDALGYLRDVAPVFRAKGCAIEACHGDPRATLHLHAREPDARGAIDELHAVWRRVRPGEVRASLLYQRATDRSHARDAALGEGSCEANVLRDWIDGRTTRGCVRR